MHGMLLVSSRQPLPSPKRRTIRMDVDKPSAVEQQSMWQEALGPMAPALNGQLAALVSQFSLSAQTIQSACADALAKIEDDNPSSSLLGPHLPSLLWDACRVHARARLDDLAQRIETVADWNDLVLPEAQLQTLREITAHVQQRAKVYENWGFATKGSRGLGISALFAGESGTGKTMAAEVLARRAPPRPLSHRSRPRWSASTSARPRRTCAACSTRPRTAARSCCSTKPTRSSANAAKCKDSHDRYANIEVSYLLQRMEAYRGLAILTTNLKTALDTAFLRRLRFVVQFPFPDAAQRGSHLAQHFSREHARSTASTMPSSRGSTSPAATSATSRSTPPSSPRQQASRFACRICSRRRTAKRPNASGRCRTPRLGGGCETDGEREIEDGE